MLPTPHFFIEVAKSAPCVINDISWVVPVRGLLFPQKPWSHPGHRNITCMDGQAHGQGNCRRPERQSRTETVRPDLTVDLSLSPSGLRWKKHRLRFLRVVLYHGRPVAVPGYTARIANVSGARCVLFTWFT